MEAVPMILGVNQRRVDRGSDVGSPKRRDDLAIDLRVVGVRVDLGVRVDVCWSHHRDERVDIGGQGTRRQWGVMTAEQKPEIAVAGGGGAVAVFRVRLVKAGRGSRP
jgi:hypothetical protein